MPVLHIEEVPADLYDRLRRRAEARDRELTTEVLDLLERALATEEEARGAHAAALADLRAQRWSPPPGTPDSVAMLREDRDQTEVDRPAGGGTMAL
jgi:plasmid stability protein